jgi:predicted DCC family thiol-disulfide oxidoreductase YuxK
MPPLSDPRGFKSELEHRPNARAEFVFDGNCGFCTRFVLWLQRLDRRGQLQITPWQQPGTLERTGLGHAQVSSAAWFVSSGTPLRAAAAVNAALSLASGWDGFARVYALPLVGTTQEFVYAWIAAHRHRFRGVKAHCARADTVCLEGPTGCSTRP